MRMTQKSVPKATLQRYPVYLKALRKLKHPTRSKRLKDFVDKP